MPNPDAITRGYQNAKSVLRRNTVNALGQMWYAMPEYRDANVDRFVEVATPVMRGAQRRQSQLTAAYHRGISAMRGDDIPMALLPPDVVDNPRDGVALEAVMRRPANDVYKALAREKSMTDAVEAGRRRLANIAETNLQLVSTKQSDFRLSKGGYRYYRRVLTGAENCALCIIASTQRYTVGDLMPIHPACDCTVDSVDANFDPGQVLDPETLERTHGMVAEFAGVSDRSATGYSELIVNTSNSELGPILDWRKRYDRESLSVAERILGVAQDTEPGLTSLFSELSQQNQAEMVDLEFRLKTRERLYEKVRDKVADEKINPGDVVISDANRYTMVVSGDRYGATVRNVVNELGDQGYQLRVKNYWQPNAEYKGVNIAGLTPEKTRFELQFHTPQSHEVKQQGHALYEIQRSASSSPAQKESAGREMVRLWDQVTAPRDLDLVPDPREGVYSSALKAQRAEIMFGTGSPQHLEALRE